MALELTHSAWTLADWSATIVDIQQQFIAQPDTHSAFEQALRRMGECSRSEWGLIGRLHRTNNGECSIELLAALGHLERECGPLCVRTLDDRPQPGHLVSILGAVIRSGRPAMANSPATAPDPETAGAGLPRLESCLALPLSGGDGELAGVAVLANGADGYDDDLISQLQPMCVALGVMIGSVQRDLRRREAEAAMQTSENRLRIFADHVAIGLLLHDSQGRVLDVNRQACEKLGYSRAELIGIDPTRFNPTLTVDQVRELGERLAAGETLTFDSWNRRKDGTEFPVEVRVNPLWIDGVLHGLSVVSDITERKRTEKRLQESQERLGLALSASGMGVWELDLCANIVYLSPECCEVFGCQKFDGRAESLRALVHPDDRSAHDEEIRRTISDGSSKSWEYRVVAADGSLRWIANCAFLQRDEHGRVVKLIGTARDITREKLAARALLEAERRLSLVLKGANVGTWDWDLDTNQVYYSSELKGHLGYGADAPFTHYDDWETRVHPDDLPQALARVRRALKQRSRDYTSEFRMRHKDGSWRWILSLGSVITDAEGRPIRMLGVHIDISDRKRAEEAVRESESRYRTFVDHATDALFLQDHTGRVIDVNEQACVSLGYSREELIGMLPYEFDPDFTPASNVKFQAQLDRGDVLTFDSRHRRKDGSTFPVEIRLRPFWSNGVRYHIGLARDITERRRTEQAIRESEARLRTLLENLDRVAVQAYEPDGTITFWNRASELFYGYAATEVVGKNLVELLYPESAREREHHIMAEAIRTGVQPAAEEMELVRCDGTKVTVLSSRVVHPRPGKEPEFFCFDVDITDRIRAEEELARRQAELLHASRLSTVGQMVAEISHEVAQPLNAIGNFAAASERILEVDGEDQLGTLKEYVRAILDQNERCVTILGRLRDFSRRSPASRTACDIARLLHDSVELMSLELRRNRVRIGLQLEGKLPTVTGDRIQLQQVIVNLLTNARDALLDQPVERRYIAIRATAAPDAVVVEVEDAGCGLSKDAMSRLFEPFYTTKQHGMGIGLSISQTILKEHGGRIEACSNSKGGATFRVRLPIERKNSHV